MEINIIKSIIKDFNSEELKELEEYIENNSDFRLVAPIVLSRNDVLEIYGTRYDVQRNVTNSNVLGYRYLLTNVKKSLVNEVIIIGIYTRIGYYALFFKPSMNELLGCLINKSKVL